MGIKKQMYYKNNTSEWLAVLAEAVEQVLGEVVKNSEVISTLELVEEAHDQVQIMRAEVRRYDADRKNEPKPCKNCRMIADRIAEQLALRHKWRYVPRAYAYMVMFIMYIICKVDPPIRCSWWERKFLEDLPFYLEDTDLFKDTSCRTRWAIILDQLPGQNRLPLDIIPITPPQQQITYPPSGPITIFKDCNFYLLQTNHGCQQFFDDVNNPTFQ